MHAISQLVSHWLASGKLLVSHCKRAWEGSVRKFELPHEPRREVQGSLSQKLPRDGGWKKYCQCSHNSRRANQGPRILPAGPPTPKFNVGSLVLGPPLRVEEILPVNIEIGGAGGVMFLCRTLFPTLVFPSTCVKDWQYFFHPQS